MWNLLGERGVDILSWENFGNEWTKDGVQELKLDNLRTFTAPFGELPDLSQIDFNNDVVFTWNGTSSGVMVPDRGAWIPADRTGLTLVDATSCIFGVDLPWDKLDAVSWSWQKVMGGEAAHGMLALSPRAVERLNTFHPDRAIPKVFRLKKNGKINPEPFEGATLNTPSLLCVEDALDGLRWAEDIGGLPVLMGRVQSNFEALSRWVERTSWIDFLATDPAVRSCTSVTLKVVDPAFDGLSEDDLRKTLRRIPQMCEAEGAGYDFSEHKSAPPGFRIWCGATVETSDLEALFPWIEWSFHQIRAELAGGQGHRGDEHAVRQFHHHGRTRYCHAAGPGPRHSPGQRLDPRRQVGEIPLHGGRDHGQGTGHHRLRQYRIGRRRPGPGLEDAGHRL